MLQRPPFPARAVLPCLPESRDLALCFLERKPSPLLQTTLRIRMQAHFEVQLVRTNYIVLAWLRVHSLLL